MNGVRTLENPVGLAMTTAVSTLAILLFVACGGPAESSGPSDADTGVVRIDMIDNAFRPARLSLKADSTVTFELPNKGKLPHNMHIASARGVYRESPWISAPSLIEGGETGQLAWHVPSTPGNYKFRCDYHEVEMVGVLTVE